MCSGLRRCETQGLPLQGGAGSRRAPCPGKAKKAERAEGTEGSKNGRQSCQLGLRCFATLEAAKVACASELPRCHGISTQSNVCNGASASEYLLSASTCTSLDCSLGTWALQVGSTETVEVPEELEPLGCRMSHPLSSFLPFFLPSAQSFNLFLFLYFIFLVRQRRLPGPCGCRPLHWMRCA